MFRARFGREYGLDLVVDPLCISDSLSDLVLVGIC